MSGRGAKMKTSILAGSRAGIALAFATLVLAGCASVVRDYIYLPDPLPAAVKWTTTAPETVTAETADGLKLTGYYWPPHAPGGDLYIFFHGNGGNGLIAAERAQALVAKGAGLMIADYRGYGGNPGAPSEPGLFADGEAFFRLSQARAPGSPIYLFGHSLGGAVALELAGRRDVAGVITYGAFCTLAEVAPSYVRGALPDRYDNCAAIGRVTAPLLLIHGTADDIIPFEQAGKLKAAAGPSARLLKLDGAPHAIDMTALAPYVWDNVAAMPR